MPCTQSQVSCSRLRDRAIVVVTAPSPSAISCAQSATGLSLLSLTLTHWPTWQPFLSNNTDNVPFQRRRSPLRVSIKSATENVCHTPWAHWRSYSPQDLHQLGRSENSERRTELMKSTEGLSWPPFLINFFIPPARLRLANSFQRQWSEHWKH